MGGMIVVHPFVPAAELTVGPGFDSHSVAEFVARWSLIAAPDSPGHYLTAADIAEGTLPRITADTDCLAIGRPAHCSTSRRPAREHRSGRKRPRRHRTLTLTSSRGGSSLIIRLQPAHG